MYDPDKEKILHLHRLGVSIKKLFQRIWAMANIYH